jgi:lysophospholipase L1-like esterase
VTEWFPGLPISALAEDLADEAAFSGIGGSYDVAAAAKAAGMRLHATVIGNRSVTAQGVTVGSLLAEAAASSTSIGTATFADTGDLVTTSVAHGLVVGDRISFGTLTGAGGVSANNVYYVKTVPTSTTFTFSGSSGGATQTITSDGSTVAVYRREVAYLNSAVNSGYRITGGRAIQANASFPRNNNIAPDPTVVTFAPGTSTGTALEVTTQYEGAAIDVLLRNGGTTKRIYVDGLLAATVTNADLTAAGVTGGQVARLPLTFADARRRTIMYVEESGGEFKGFDIRPGYNLSYPAGQAKGPRVLFSGDSFVEGTGVTAGFGMARWLAWDMAWADLWKAGSGSTGYYYDGTRLALVDRYVNDLIAQAPNILIIAMGLNDRVQWNTDPAPVIAAATTIYDAVAVGLPNAEVIVVGPWSPQGAGYVQTGLAPMDAALQALVEAHGWRYISPIQEDWITGNGKVGATTGNGNADIYISSDGTHPSDAGHEYLAWRLAGHLATPYLPSA